MINSSEKKALLLLQDGTLFCGRSRAGEGAVCGEIVFNTAPSGYQEVCTDPSYDGQIVLFTHPHIGNVGANNDDCESERVRVKGIIVLEMAAIASNWKSETSFPAFLAEHRIPWIEGIDTRKLTRHLRDHGTQRGCLLVGSCDKANALAILRKSSAMANSTYFNSNSKVVESSSRPSIKIALYDFGVKKAILDQLTGRGCSIHLFGGNCAAGELLAINPDGIILSNGPGDPASMVHAINETRRLLAAGPPMLGICLGCQLIALAAGGSTRKMKFGHHGINHPVYCPELNKTVITSQNHNFTIDRETLPDFVQITHSSLFDGTIQGIKLQGLPVFGFQGHPEGSPGPRDCSDLFEEFLQAARAPCL